MPIRGNDLAVAVADGELWISRGGECPRRFPGDRERFLASLLFRGSDEVAIAATAGGSRLIVDAYDRCAELGIPLWLCGPRVATGPRPWTRPRSLVAAVSALATSEDRLPASLGGRHRMTEFERGIYGAAAALERTGTDWPAAAAIGGHALVRAMGFAAWLRTPRVCRIIAEIRDPRWFVDPIKPNAMSPLYARFGLGGRSLGSRRAAVVRSALGRQLEDGPLGTDPRRMLFRRHHAFHRAVREPRTAEAATSRFFLRVLRAVWLALLHPDNSDFLEFGPLFEAAFTHGASGDADHARDDVAIAAAGGLREWVLEVAAGG